MIASSTGGRLEPGQTSASVSGFFPTYAGGAKPAHSFRLVARKRGTLVCTRGNPERLCNPPICDNRGALGHECQCNAKLDRSIRMPVAAKETANTRLSAVAEVRWAR
jgi:hypothetical protein